MVNQMSLSVYDYIAEFGHNGSIVKVMDLPVIYEYRML
jgi:hypothetical protein